MPNSQRGVFASNGLVILAIGGEYKNLLLITLVLAQLGKPPILVFLLLQYPINAYPCLLLELFLPLSVARQGLWNGMLPREAR